MPDEPITMERERRYLIRTYRGGDEMALVSLWNQSLPRDTIHPRAFLTKILCDPNFDHEGAILAVNPEEEAMGFLFAVVRRTPLWRTDLESDEGWIVALFVHPEHRRRGLGTALVRAADQFFRKSGRSRVLFGPYVPGWVWPGLDKESYPAGWAFMREQGFERLYTTRTWGRRLVGFAIPEDVQELYGDRVPEGYQFGPLIPGYVASLVTLAAERFHPDWGRLLREAIAGEIPLDQILICTDADGRLVGFASYGVPPGAADRLGPMGVHTAHRGKGLGRVLLHLCLDAMRSRGLHAAWMLWARQAPSLDKLLAGAHFEPLRSFEVLEKRRRERG